MGWPPRWRCRVPAPTTGSDRKQVNGVPAFLPVVIADEALAAKPGEGGSVGRVEVGLPNGVVLRLEAEFDIASVAELAASLRFSL